MSPQLPYQTQLDPQQESEFQRYVQLSGRRDVSPQDKQAEVNFPGSDYDTRGAWLAAKKGLDASGNWDQGTDALTAPSGDGTIHGTDVFKTPYHRTLSNESKYAPPGAAAWNQNSQLQSQGALGNPLSPALRQPVSTLADESQYARNLAVQKLLGSKLMPQHADGGVIAPQGNQSMNGQYGQQPQYGQLGRTLMGAPQQQNQAAGQSQMPSQAPAWGMRNQPNPQGQQYGQAAAHMPSQANAYGMRGTMPPMSQPAQPRQPMGGTMASGGDNMHAFADGGVVAPQPPSRLQALWQALMGRNVLQQAAGPSQAPPPPPPPEMQDTSIVHKAAEDAARRMQAEKAAQGKPQMCSGGVVR